MSGFNPWAGPSEVAPVASPVVERSARVWKPGAQVSMVSGLPIVDADGEDCGLWVVAAHGGAGATSWARLLSAGDAGVSWPRPVSVTRAVVVARSSLVGLQAAQVAAIQWASGQVAGVELVGLILGADAPGRMPKDLVDLRRRVAGAYPKVWQVGFQNNWRSHLAWNTPVCREVGRVLKDISLIRKEV